MVKVSGGSGRVSVCRSVSVSVLVSVNRTLGVTSVCAVVVHTLVKVRVLGTVEVEVVLLINCSLE